MSGRLALRLVPSNRGSGRRRILSDTTGNRWDDPLALNRLEPSRCLTSIVGRGKLAAHHHGLILLTRKRVNLIVGGGACGRIASLSLGQVDSLLAQREYDKLTFLFTAVYDQIQMIILVPSINAFSALKSIQRCVSNSLDFIRTAIARHPCFVIVNISATRRMFQIPLLSTLG